MSNTKTDNKNLLEKITYEKLFWLFMAGSVIGVLMEGTFTLLKKGHWESHVTSVIGPFNILYGFGAVFFFCGAHLLRKKNIALRVGVLMAAATALEFLVGFYLKYRMGMIAWDYSKSPLNVNGIICFGFMLIWGLCALLMCLGYEKVNALLSRIHGKTMRVLTIVLSVFMAINIAFAALVIFRWDDRYYGWQATNSFDKYLDQEYNDDYMKKRFMDWKFIESPDQAKGNHGD